MPLKLLGKKSWNVYNAANIERVRRDEAAARAREADEERQRKEAESARRLALLRGEEPEEPEEKITVPSLLPAPSAPPADRLRPPKRKRHGEDDTDFEMRLAQTQMGQEDVQSAKRSAADKKRAEDHAHRSLVDRDGHIDLFGGEGEERRDKGTAKEATGPPDMINMRFADAAGRGKSFGAWYTGDAEAGDRRPTRQSRQPRHPPLPSASTSDPLAAMKQGAATMRALTQERRREAEERARDMVAMDAEAEARERHRKRRHRHHHHHQSRSRRDDDRHSTRKRDEDGDSDSLEGFSLEEGTDKKRESRRDERDKRDKRDGKDGRDRSQHRNYSRHSRRRHEGDRDRDRDREKDQRRDREPHKRRTLS